MSDDARNPFEKSGEPPRKPAGGRSRLPVGVIFAIVLAVLIVGGVILFSAASGAGGPATGSTTGGGLISLLPLP